MDDDARISCRVNSVAQYSKYFIVFYSDHASWSSENRVAYKSNFPERNNNNAQRLINPTIQRREKCHVWLKIRSSRGTDWALNIFLIESASLSTRRSYSEIASEECEPRAVRFRWCKWEQGRNKRHVRGWRGLGNNKRQLGESSFGYPLYFMGR